MCVETHKKRHTHGGALQECSASKSTDIGEILNVVYVKDNTEGSAVTHAPRD